MKFFITVLVLYWAKNRSKFDIIDSRNLIIINRLIWASNSYKFEFKYNTWIYAKEEWAFGGKGSQKSPIINPRYPRILEVKC
jgi:hypothetical protein